MSFFETIGVVDKKKAERDADNVIAATGKVLFDEFLRETGEDKRAAFFAGLKAAFIAAFASNQLQDKVLGPRASRNTNQAASVGDAKFVFDSAERREQFQRRVAELAKEMGAEVSDLNQKPTGSNGETVTDWLNNLMFGRGYRRPVKSPFEPAKDNDSGRPTPEPAAPAATGTATTETPAADPVVNEATAQNAAVAAAPLLSDTELSE